MQNKKHTVTERLEYYTQKLTDLKIAAEITMSIYEAQANYIKKRIAALEKEKTETKEKDSESFSFRSRIIGNK